MQLKNTHEYALMCCTHTYSTHKRVRLICYLKHSLLRTQYVCAAYDLQQRPQLGQLFTARPTSNYDYTIMLIIKHNTIKYMQNKDKKSRIQLYPLISKPLSCRRPKSRLCLTINAPDNGHMQLQKAVWDAQDGIPVIKHQILYSNKLSNSHTGIEDQRTRPCIETAMQLRRKVPSSISQLLL